MRALHQLLPEVEILESFADIFISHSIPGRIQRLIFQLLVLFSGDDGTADMASDAVN